MLLRSQSEARGAGVSVDEAWTGRASGVIMKVATSALLREGAGLPRAVTVAQQTPGAHQAPASALPARPKILGL